MMLQPKVVLVAEDEPIIRLVAFEVLTEAGYDVIEAEHAEGALAVLSAEARVDVLFTDIRMPGLMDGLQLAHHVRGRWPWVGLLVASGNARPHASTLPDQARFLAKPYDCQDMLDHVLTLTAAN